MSTSRNQNLYNLTDKAKLDGIETGAEVNPTPAAIKSDYESNANTNAFTDAEKTKLGNLTEGYLGWYADDTALNTAHPTGSDGQYATVGSTDTIWSWDSDTTAWVNTDTNSMGDMLKATYDPTAKNADAFSMDNMDETATKKILSDTERTEISSNTTHRGTVTGNPHDVKATQITDFQTQVSANSDVTANTAKVSNVTTNLTTTQTATTVNVNSSDGTDATIPQAIASGNAGVMSGGDKNNVDQNTTHRGQTNNPHAVTKAQIGLGDVENIKVNLNASADPTVGDDSNDDYSIGSIWVNTTASPRRAFFCKDASVGAAVWDEYAGQVQNLADPNNDVILFYDDSAGEVAFLTLGDLIEITGTTLNVTASKVIMSDYISGSTLNPQTNATTAGTAVTVAEMTKTFTPANATNRIEVHAGSRFNFSKNDNGVYCSIFVDGVEQPETHRACFGSNDDEDYPAFIQTMWAGTLSAAPHTIDLRMWTSGNNVIATENYRNFYIKEIQE